MWKIFIIVKLILLITFLIIHNKLLHEFTNNYISNQDDSTFYVPFLTKQVIVGSPHETVTKYTFFYELTSTLACTILLAYPDNFSLALF